MVYDRLIAEHLATRRIHPPVLLPVAFLRSPLLKVPPATRPLAPYRPVGWATLYALNLSIYAWLANLLPERAVEFGTDEDGLKVVIVTHFHGHDVPSA